MLYILIGILIIVALIDCYLKSSKKTPSNYNEINSDENTAEADTDVKTTDESPYYKALLLTKDEWNFYKFKLKPLADKYHLHILSKVRLEDIAAVKKGIDKKEYSSARGRVMSRHIDFVIADPSNLRILLALELDGKSHESIKQQQNDHFKDTLFTDIGLPFIRTNGKNDIEAELCEKLCISKK